MPEMEVHEKISEITDPVEKEWLPVLFSHCASIFNITPLPSHDQWHHLRVWQNTKLLLCHTWKPNHWVDRAYAKALMIAVFFHDTGLSVTHNIRHGKESRELCKHFFNNSTYEIPEHFAQTLHAIEKHDDKNYTTKNLFSGDTLSFNALVSIADDLDAFGPMGAFRYLEIYLKRQIPFNKLGIAVLTNLDNRFNNFIQLCSPYKDLIDLQTNRYKQTRLWINQILQSSLTFEIIEDFTKEKNPDFNVLLEKLDKASGEAAIFGKLLEKEHFKTKNLIVT